ncbi:hypothetical protein LTR95_006967 [Oleoguttula sp. CCFEE 5521]
MTHNLLPGALTSATSAEESRKAPESLRSGLSATPLLHKSEYVPLGSSPSREADKLVETSFAAAPVAEPTPKSEPGKTKLAHTKLQQTPDRTPTITCWQSATAQAESIEIAHDRPLGAAPTDPAHKRDTAVKTAEAPANPTNVVPAATATRSKAPANIIEQDTQRNHSTSTKSARPAMAKRGGFKGVLGKRAPKIANTVPALLFPTSPVQIDASLRVNEPQGTIPAEVRSPGQISNPNMPHKSLATMDVPTRVQSGKPLPLRSQEARSAEPISAPEQHASAGVPRGKPNLPTSSTDSTMPASVPATQVPAWTEEKLAQIKDQLGDSHKRPRGTARFSLVGMALASATGHRLQSVGVIKWVADNIPTYKFGEGDWENSLTALLSTGQSRAPNAGYWKQYEWTAGSGGIGTGCWWELLPGEVDEMWHWDAQRKQPIQPRRALSSGPTGISTRKDQPQDAVRSRKRKAKSQAASPVLHPADRIAKRKIGTELQSSLKSDCADTPLVERLSKLHDSVSFGETPTDGYTSSDEEPIMKKRRKLTPSALTTTLSSKSTPIPVELEIPMPHIIRPERPPRAVMIGVRATTEEKPAVVPGSAIVMRSTGPADLKPRPHSMSIQDVKKTPVLTPTAEEIGLANYIVQQAPRSDFSARSLFTEWPQYHPSHTSSSTTSSIRLTRKQLFGKPACYSRLGSSHRLAQPASPMKRATMSPEKRPKAIVDAQPDDPYPWEEDGTDDGGERREVESFEQLLGLSEDPVMKILWEGDLAFREEVRMESGRLARGQGVYVTGYSA